MDDAPDEPVPFKEGYGKVWRGARLREDGTLKTPRMERMAWLMVEGFDDTTVWKTVGGGGKTTTYRRSILGDKVFKGRVERLREDHAKCMALGPIGEAMWMAKTTYSEARLANDIPTMLRATQIIANLAEKVGLPDTASTPPPKEAKADVGRPALRGAQQKRSASEMREALLARGVRAPAA